MDDELALASAQEQGQQGLAEGYPFQPQNLAQQGQIAADIRQRQQPRPMMGMGGGVGALSAYTNSDNLQAQRLANGLSQTSNLVASGELTPEEGAQYQQQIQAQLGPLQMKQSKAQAQQMQQSVHQAMQASALQAGIEAVNMKARADAFPKTTSFFTDPVTGETEHFYQKKPGEWHEVQFTRHEASKDRASQGEASSAQAGWSGDTYTSPDQARWINDFKPVADQLGQEQPSSPPVTPTSQQQPSPPPAAAQPPKPPDNRHQMTIWNGNHKQVFAFNPDGTMETLSDTRPPGEGGLEDSQATAIRQRAVQMGTQMFGPRPQVPGGLPPQLAAQYFHAQRTWDTQTGALLRNMLTAHTREADRELMHGYKQEDMQAKSDEAKRHEEAMAKVREQHSSNYLAHRKSLTKKDVNGNEVMPSAADILKSMQEEQDAYHKLHGEKLPSPTAAPPQTPDALGQQFLQSLQK